MTSVWRGFVVYRSVYGRALCRGDGLCVAEFVVEEGKGRGGYRWVCYGFVWFIQPKAVTFWSKSNNVSLTVTGIIICQVVACFAGLCPPQQAGAQSTYRSQFGVGKHQPRGNYMPLGNSRQWA